MSDQSMRALQSANQTRIRRKHLRLALRAGTITLRDLLDKPEPALHNLAIGDLLCWQPRVGWAVADRVCDGICLSGDRVGELNVRQRSELLDRIDWGPRAAELYAAGQSTRQVALELGVHQMTVIARMERDGYPRRHAA